MGIFARTVRYLEFAILHYVDLIYWHDKIYLPNPPLPSILLMPFVAIWGIATEQIRVCMLVGAIDVFLVWILLGRMTVQGALRIGLTILYGFGTVHYSASIIGLAHMGTPRTMDL